MRARMAAGSSVASWNSAVERAWPGRMPESGGAVRSRWAALIGRPGCPPGNSQGEVPWSPMVAWPWRVATRWRTRAASGFGQDDGFAAEAEPTCLPSVVDVVEGESADRGGPLGVEQDEQAGDAVVGVERVVVQQPAGLLPAGLVVDDAGRAVPIGWRRSRRRGRASGCLAQRTKCPAWSRWLVLRCWPARCRGRPGGQLARVRSWAVSQSSRAMAARTLLRGRRRPGRGWSSAPLLRLPQPAQHVPDRRSGAASACSSGSARLARVPVIAPLEPGHVLVAGGQRAGGDQDAAQVLERLGVGQFVEGGVGERAPAGGEVGQDRRRGLLGRARPARCRAVRWLARLSCSACSSGRIAAGVVGEQLAQPLLRAAAGARPGDRAGRAAAARAGVPEAGSGTGAGRAERCGAGAAADRRGPGRSRLHRARPLLAGRAPRLPGGLGDPAGRRACRRSSRSGSGSGAAAGAERPVRGADADRARGGRSRRRSPGWRGR